VRRCCAIVDSRICHCKSASRIAVNAHLTKTGETPKTAIVGRTTRHPGYAISQRIRKRIEEGFGHIKTVAILRKTRHRGTARVGFMFTLAAAAYNLVRIPKLLAAAIPRRARAAATNRGQLRRRQSHHAVGDWRPLERSAYM
jgi:Transposase DDE domain